MGMTATASGWTYVLGVTLQTARHKLAERLGERTLQGRWRVLGNQEEDLYKHADHRQRKPSGGI